MDKKSPVKCHKCGYQWETKSQLGLISCGNCGSKVKNPTAKIQKK